MNTKIRNIPKEDMKVFTYNHKFDKEYKNGVFCICGATILFKNREPYETVIIKCPICKKEIMYG